MVVTCWTCHRGRAIPARLPRESWQKIQAEHRAEFDGNANRGLAMSVYAASLGVTCSHCHEDQDRAANSRPPTTKVAARNAHRRQLIRAFPVTPRSPLMTHRLKPKTSV